MGNCNPTTTNSEKLSGNGSRSQAKYNEDNNAPNVTSSAIRIHTSSILNLTCYENWIGSCSDDQTVAITDATALLNNTEHNPITLKGHQKAVNKVLFVPPRTFTDTLKLWSASRDLSLKLWDLANPRIEAENTVIQEIKNSHSLNITALGTLASRSDILVSGSRDYSVKLWDINTSQLEREYKMSRNIVTAIATSAQHPHVIFQSSEDLTVKLWDTRESTASLPTASISGFVYFALAMDINSEGNLLATGCKGFNSVGCNVFTWDLRKLPNIQDFKSNFIYSAGPNSDLNGHSQDVTCCLFSKLNSQYLYSASKDGSLYVWNVSDSSYNTYKFPKKYITSMSFIDRQYINSNSESIEYLAISCMDGSLVIMSYSFDSLRFGIIKMTRASFDNDEIEY